MLKLVKYEFLKARVALAALLGVSAALEIYFLISLNLKDDRHVIISLALLTLCAYALTIFALVRGVTTYSSELNRRSGWLLFMTPNSTLKIMGSKFLYTFLNGFFFAALISVMAAIDFRLTMVHYGEWNTILELLRSFLSMQGVPVNDLLVSALFLVFYGFARILSEIALAYLAITFSATLFRENKLRWIPSLIIFFGLSYLVGWICGKFPSPMDEVQLIGNAARYAQDTEVGVSIVADGLRNRVLPALMPTAAVSLAVILISLFGCSGMLKKWVSL